MYAGNSELTTCLYLCCLTLQWRTKRFSFIPIFIIKFENQDPMLLKTSCLPWQHRVWQNSTGWRFQFAHINPDTKYQKAFAKMLCVEKTRQKHWRSLSVALPVQCKILPLFICFQSDHRAHTSAGNTAAVPLLSTDAWAHLAIQALLLLWGYPKAQLEDPLQESRPVCGKKLLWNLWVTIQKCVPQPKQFQQTSESNNL